MGHVSKFTALVCCTLAAAPLFADPATGWKQTGAGSYDYNDTDNWVDGVVNGVFGSDLSLANNQTIRFSQDTTLPDGLSIAYSGNYALTFQSDGTGAKTLTLGGGITANVSKNGKNAHVTFGSATTADNLVFDLGGENKTFTQSATQNDPSNTGWMKIYATIQNGSVTYSGLGPIKIYGSHIYSGGTTLANTGYIYMNNTACFGSGTVTIADCGGSAWPRLHADSSVSIANNFYVLGDFGFHSAHGTTFSGTITIPSPVRFWCEDNGLSLNGQAILDGNGGCGVANLCKWGSKTYNVYTPITVDGTAITVANGVWNQYGKISGGALSIVGDANGGGGSGFFRCFSAEDDFTGDVSVTGYAQFCYVSFQTAGALPDGVTILLTGRGCLEGCQTAGYACGTLLSGGRIDSSSTGCLAFANTENVNVDLTDYPGLSLATSGNANYYGRITPANGVYRFCSPSHIYLGAENALTGKADVLVEMPSSSTSLYLEKSNDVEGKVIIRNCGLIVRNDTGALPNAEVHVHGGNFYINSNKNTGARRAEYVHLHGGTLTCAGNGNNATTDTIGELVLDVRDPKYGVIGGINQISLNAGGKTAKLHVEKFTRANNSLWRLCGTEANNRILVGGADGENTVQFTVGNETTVQSELVGGGGAAGTTTISIYPYAIVHLGAGGYHEYDSLVTYGNRGFRPLDYETEFETSITPGTVSHVNVRLPVGSTTEITSDTTVNAVFMQGSNPDKGSTYLTGGKTLTISSGVIVMGYHRNAAPYVQCATINFGGKPGVINFAKGKGSNWQSAIHGSAGAIFFQCDLISENNSNGTGVTISGENASASTLTGDVIIHGKVVNNSDNTFPGGTARPGNIYANGYCQLLDGTYGFNGVFGIGALFRADNSDTIVIGANGADGDFAGTLIRTTKIIKESSGRQRLSGASSHTGATTVSAGVLQLDGSFTASAVTVASGATLAGCGTFGQGVTLADGAKLEVGSAQLGTDDAVMDFDGGLTLSGDAAATFKVLGNAAVASLEASSVAGTGTLTVSLDSGELKSGDYLLAKSDAAIPFAYARGENCGILSLRNNSTELWMTKSSGLSIIVR